MEELEKRKERLKAIREEAGDNNEEQNSVGGSLDHGLTNPLIECPSASLGQDEPRPRFDSVSPQVSQSCNTPPRSMDAGSPAYHAQGNYNSAKRTYQPRGVNAIPLGIRRKIGDVSSDDFPQGGGAGSQYEQGSPYQGSGSKGGSYQRGSRGGGNRYKFYYHKSMVEDPWKRLKPVIWKPRGDTRDSTKTWLQNSISTKKAKLGETPTKFTPPGSLAEYLASAFNEAAGEGTVNNESGT